MKREQRALILFTAVSVIDLLILYAFKYSNQNVNISEFSFFYTGNFLNFLIVLLITAGLALLHKMRIEKFSRRIKLFASLAVLSTILLLLAGMFSSLQISFPDVYILRYPLSKVFIGFVYAVFQFIQLMWLCTIWLSLLGTESLLLLKSAVNAGIIVILLLVFSYLYSQWKITLPPLKASESDPADVVVVLGAAVWPGNQPSEVLKSRVNKAYELYSRGLASKIQLTGSNAPGELSEAQVALNYIKRYLKAADDIMLEYSTTSTTEQIGFIRKNLIDRKGYGSIIIVSDRYHLKRIYEICRFHNFEPDLADSDMRFNTKKLFYYKIREAISLLLFWLFAPE